MKTTRHKFILTALLLAPLAALRGADTPAKSRISEAKTGELKPNHLQHHETHALEETV